ncbi:MAG TPA: sodium:proton antiporter [Gammaproteobacteria bacterium]|nr:sodium:proton antiporter [Gammaproteobacteria bacterium]
MHDHSIVFSMFLIFTGAAVISTVALYARQALLVAYIALGVLMGPWGLQLVSDAELIADIAEVGIIFLLFLLGLNLEPKDLQHLFREAVVVTAASCAIFALGGGAIALAFGFSWTDAALIGAVMMFSSTIIGLKLLPTSALHHQHMGEIIVSILLLQDMLAVIIMLVVQGLGNEGNLLRESVNILVALPAIAAGSYFFSRYVLLKLFAQFDQIKEYIFLLAIGWCLGIAELGRMAGLSHEIGAFIAGVTLAANPIARYIAESLKPLRDFFLVMFFFALGAGYDLSMLGGVLLPGMALAAFALALKPQVFRLLLKREKEKERLAGEIGVRLGQISEFALLIVVVSSSSAIISERGASLIQTATILSFLVSSYWIVRHYPTPIAVNERLRRD